MAVSIDSYSVAYDELPHFHIASATPLQGDFGFLGDFTFWCLPQALDRSDEVYHTDQRTCSLVSDSGVLARRM